MTPSTTIVEVDKRAEKTEELFIELCDTMEMERLGAAVKSDVDAKAVELARYLFHHGGWFRLANSLKYLAQAVDK